MKKVKPASQELRYDDFLTIVKLLWTGGGWKAGLIWWCLFITEQIKIWYTVSGETGGLHDY